MSMATTTLITLLLFAFAVAAPTFDNRQQKDAVRYARKHARHPQADPPYPSDVNTYPAGFYPTVGSVGHANPSGYAASSGYAFPSGSPSTHPPNSGGFSSPHIVNTGSFKLPTLTSTTSSTSSTVSGSPLETGTSNATTTCAPNGALICNGLYQFGLCNWDRVVWQEVANGTACYDGRIDFAPGYPMK